MDRVYQNKRLLPICPASTIIWALAYITIPLRLGLCMVASYVLLADPRLGSAIISCDYQLSGASGVVPGAKRTA